MDQISQIKQQLDVVNVVGSYVQLKKSGKNYTGLCPFHSEKSPSFMVSPELQIFKCFGCGKSGDILQFVQDIEGVDFSSALEQLAEKAGIKLEKVRLDPDAALKKQLYWVNEMAAHFYNYILMGHSAGRLGLDYFKKRRGLSDGTIKNFDLGYAPDRDDTLYKYFSGKGVDIDLLVKAGLVIKKDYGGYLDKFRGRVIFPLTGIDGKVLGFTARTIFDREPKYLNTAETPVFHKSYFIFALDKAKVAIKKLGAVFVEGQMDAISAHEAGITNVIASSGTSLTTAQLKMVSRYTTDLTFCFDSDNAGVGASFRGIELAESLGFSIKVAVIPAGFKDLDELIKSSRLKAEEMLASAVPAYDYLLFSIIKKFNKNSPDGKKKIIDEIAPWFSRITNKVLLDHYTKEIAAELDLNVETVTEAINTGKSVAFTENGGHAEESPIIVSPQSVESYIITLLFKGGLDFIKDMTYKVEPQDIADDSLRGIIDTLRDYLNAGSKKLKKFDPKDFAKTLNADQSTLFESLYLKESGTGISDDQQLKKEFDSALHRLRKESAKRRMHTISTEIKLAEKSGDSAAVEKLTTEFENLKNQLI